MNRFCTFSVLVALVCIGTASVAVAGPKPGAAAKATVVAASAEFGFTFAVPTGLTIQVDRFPHATREQFREVVTVLRESGEVVRLDVFVDKSAVDLESWVRTEFEFQIKHGSLRKTVATARRVPAFELALPGGQVDPQTIRFWRDGPLFFRLTLGASSQLQARSAFEMATATFAGRSK